MCKNWRTIRSVNKRKREANVKTSAAFGFVAYSLCLLLLLDKPAPCKQGTASPPINVSVSELATHPQKYDGKLVCVKAVAVYGWEGDDFLIDPSKPVPLDMASGGDPASVWFYQKRSKLQRGQEPIEKQVSRCRSFAEYFHLVDKPQIVNGAFYPGSLQLETLKDSSDQWPRSLAAAMLSGRCR